MGILSGLEPKNVFYYFEKLCSVPHGSGNTKAISDLCVAFAAEHGLRCHQDAVNNIVIWQDGTAGRENAEPIILQGHLDMVCAKADDCTKDMAREPISLMTDGAFVWADKTSLGGDDVIAVAMVLAILADKTLPHPPIEAVFTVDEEVGMDGALALDCSRLKGRRLLNIDSEEEGEFTVSCAGGVRLDSLLPAERLPLHSGRAYTVTLSGALGGHSGVEINKGRANAAHLLARALFMALDACPSLRLADLRGGQFDNVICRECTALVTVAEIEAAALESFVSAFASALRAEYEATEPELALTCADASVSAALSVSDTTRLLRTLFLLPQGVQEMSFDFPGLVRTSLNLGVVALEAEGLRYTCSVRSAVASQKERLRRLLRVLAENAGGSVRERGDYPGWAYRRDSALRSLALDAYHDLTGREGIVKATHGGLECGLLIDKMPGLDALSLGPNLLDVHSPRERLDVASTARTYALLCEILRRMK